MTEDVLQRYWRNIELMEKLNSRNMKVKSSVGDELTVSETRGAQLGRSLERQCRCTLLHIVL